MLSGFNGASWKFYKLRLIIKTFYIQVWHSVVQIVLLVATPQLYNGYDNVCWELCSVRLHLGSFTGDAMLLQPTAAEDQRVWARSRHHCCHHGNEYEWAVYLWQTIREDWHPPAVGLPLRDVREGDREVHQTGHEDQWAQERASTVPHPQSHRQGQA